MRMADLSVTVCKVKNKAEKVSGKALVAGLPQLRSPAARALPLTY